MDVTRAHWRRSAWSNSRGNCVVVAQESGMAALRDGKDLSGPVLVVAAGTVADSVRRRHFDA